MAMATQMSALLMVNSILVAVVNALEEAEDNILALLYLYKLEVVNKLVNVQQVILHKQQVPRILLAHVQYDELVNADLVRVLQQVLHELVLVIHI